MTGAAANGHGSAVYCPIPCYISTMELDIYDGEEVLSKHVLAALDDCDCFVQLDGARANVFMERLQITLDSLPQTDERFLLCLKALLILTQESEMIPESLHLKGIWDYGPSPLFQGGYGEVWKARLTLHGSERAVAVKTPLWRILGDPTKRRKLYREVILWRQLRHAHILTFLGVCQHERRFPSVVSPWMENGTAVAFLRRNPEASRIAILHQVASALDYLHKHDPPIGHGDVRSDNVLISVSADGHHNALLGDFGISKIDHDAFNTVHSSMQHGNVRWLPPEVLFGNAQPSWSVDMWSFGMLSIELFTEDKPFAHHALDGSVVVDIYLKRTPPRPTRDELKGGALGLSDALWECIQKCWTSVPQERISAMKMVQELHALQDHA